MWSKLCYSGLDIEFPFSFNKNNNVVVAEEEGEIIVFLFKHGDHKYSFNGFLYDIKLPFFSCKSFRSKRELLSCLQKRLDEYSLWKK